jgi:hypothetical protein
MQTLIQQQAQALTLVHIPEPNPPSGVYHIDFFFPQKPVSHEPTKLGSRETCALRSSGSGRGGMLLRTELEWNVDPQPMSDRCTFGALWTLRWKMQGMLIRCVYQRGNDVFSRRVLDVIGEFVV